MLCKIKKTKKWRGTSKKFKGSAIIVTFFVMLIILTTALSLALVTIKDMKASIGASKSNLAYQAADEGVEAVMYKILKEGNTKVNQVTPSSSNCKSDGLIWDKNNYYVVELLDDTEPTKTRISCNNSTADVSTIKYIKSIGISKDNAQKTERAVTVPVRCPSAGCPP
jgi:hypothetical protein